MSAKAKYFKKMYYKAFPDSMIIESILAIIEDLKTHAFPDDSPMGLYTVGEMAAVEGFHASEAIMYELVQSLIGRSMRMLMLTSGMSPEDFLADPKLLEMFSETDEQARRCVPIILQKSIEKYGVPERIDQDKIDDLTSRSFRAIFPTN